MMAKKPKFFEKGRPFLGLDLKAANLEGKECIDILKEKMVLYGNKEEMMRELGKKYGKGKFLYFGDSLCGDLLPTKDHKDWDSVAIIRYLKEKNSYWGDLKREKDIPTHWIDSLQNTNFP